MNTYARSRTIRRPDAARRTFHWDVHHDLPAAELADLKLLLSTRSAVTENEVPDVSTWSAGLARAIVEALLGLRDKRQLERWMLPSLYFALRHLHLDTSPNGRARRACSPTSWRVHELAPGTVESAVVVHSTERTYAVAMRLEAFRGRWITTALEIA